MTTTSDHTARHQHPTSHEQPAPLMRLGSRLGPEEDFPEDLTGLGMMDLQVLRSRITRQLDHGYLTDPAGAHFWTMDRCQELQAELNARDTA